MICENCVNAKLCKGKYTRDIFIDSFRYFEKADGSLKVMEVIADNCGAFKEYPLDEKVR